ncbi:MAG: serine/threonine protein kinase [Candidatus Competibacteraceae bacterium]|nr:serine/threonine protein kinase [Candidatus Competibacteraceae bacterium]
MNEPLSNRTKVTLQALGKYRIEGVLGKGAMGVVYKGYDTVLERFVALKTVHGHLAESDEAADWLGRFKQEARAAGRCMHPNIVAIFDYGEHEHMPYIAMEYVNGKELSEYLRKKVQFNLKDALSIIYQVLTALDYAHEFGIVHRDIKPANIMLLDNGHVKVADFGIARIETANFTQQGMMIGTPSYMSPEQFRGQTVDRRADIYATGVVLFELLTGSIPYPGKSFTEILYKVASRQMQDARELNPAIPETLNAVLLKALAQDVEDRCQTANEFLSALKAAMADMPDTTLEHPVPKPEFSDLPSSWKGSVVSGWDPDVLRQAVQTLSSYIGPIAKIIVKKAAQGATDPGQFCQALASHIPEEAEQNRFLQDMRQTKTRMTQTMREPAERPTEQRPVFSAQDLETAQRHLTTYVGPIAKVLVRKAAPKSGSLKELYESLAEHIADPNERSALLGKAAKLPQTVR